MKKQATKLCHRKSHHSAEIRTTAVEQLFQKIQKPQTMEWLRNNGLSITFLLLFFVSIVGQAVTGQKQHNAEMEEQGGEQLSMTQYLGSSHFMEATCESWESEF